IYIYIYILLIERRGASSGDSRSQPVAADRAKKRRIRKTISTRRRPWRPPSLSPETLSRGATNKAGSMGTAEMISTIGWIPCSPPRSAPSAATGHGRTSSSAPGRMSPRLKSNVRYC
ncbi:unnamed protein product, partial [Musa textilis]